jgi:cation:H+ antiporter
MLLLALACLAIMVGANVVVPGLGIGLDSLIILAVFLGGLRLITRYERKNGSSEEQALQYPDKSLAKAAGVFVVAGILIILSGRHLAVTADELSRVTVLGGTFVGSFMVAVTTSLPELVTTMTAVRMGALDMAIGNILGANVMNIFIIVVADLFFRQGSFLSAVSPQNLISGLLANSLMAIAVIGLIYRSEKSVFNLGFDSIGIVALYVIGAILMLTAGMGI